MLAVIELAGRVEAGTMSLLDAVSQHVTINFVHIPHRAWIPVCVDIIKRYKGGDHDLSYQIHPPGEPERALVSAESIVENLHLDPFIGEWD